MVCDCREQTWSSTWSEQAVCGPARSSICKVSSQFRLDLNQGQSHALGALTQFSIDCKQKVQDMYGRADKSQQAAGSISGLYSTWISLASLFEH